MASEAVEDVQHEVSCFVELHSAKDLPKARSADLRDVVLSIMTDSGKELRQIGLFQTDFLPLAQRKRGRNELGKRREDGKSIGVRGFQGHQELRAGAAALRRLELKVEKA